jgi:hypothetical protein
VGGGGDPREKGELKAERERERENGRRSHHLFPRHSVFVSVHLPAWNGLTRAADALCCLKRFGEDFSICSHFVVSCSNISLSIDLSIYLSTSVQYDLVGDSFLSFWLLIDKEREREKEREMIKQRDVLVMLHQHLIISAPGCHTILTELE